ncbi:MAG TPA: 4'-phosphopantetheinyl transferase superfamily protein [Gammaproteobacteria bacterium]
MIRVYYTQAAVENIDPSVLEAWMQARLERLPPAKRLQILRLRPLSSRFNSILGWQLVEFAFRNSGYRHFKLSQLEFRDGRKPRWPDQSCDFNLSHSGSMLACALTADGLVGIDVEIIQPLRNQRMFRQVLATGEPMPEPAGSNTFFQYWTRKEAVIKAAGIGGVWDMRLIRLNGVNAHYKNSDWHLYPLDILPGYASCVASNMGNQPIHTETVAADRLIRDGG